MTPTPVVLRPLASRILFRAPRLISPWRLISAQTRSFSATPTSQVKKYTKEHEWIQVSKNKKYGVIGITNYASEALGDVVYVELPEVPMDVTAGDSIGAVESVKSASDINCPVSCKITAVNDLLNDKPKTINSGPEDDSSAGGWVAKVELNEESFKDLEDLMDPEQYIEYIEKHDG